MGRESQVAEVTDTLRSEDVDLLTLTGPGGMGKTRLALQVAAEMLDDFEDGVSFVSLASTSDPALVVSEIAQALGVSEVSGQNPLDTLKAYLFDKQLLLVLDNFEQVVDAASPVNELLAAAPRLKVLATSRIPLRLSREHQYQVPPLSLPDPLRLPPADRLEQYEAVALFVSRAKAANPSFAVNSQNAAAAAGICVQLDGLPLAIELAAARTRILSAQAILDRLGSKLGRGQGSTLKLLTGGAADLPARHKTLRATIEWSYELLDTGEKQLFERLAVFTGPFTLEAVETICGGSGLQIDSLDGVTSLVDKSLLSQQEVYDEPRFSMLQTIYEYALDRFEQSGESEELRRLHAEYYMRFAEEADPRLLEADQSTWLQRLDAEHDNLRAALGWLLRGREPDLEEAAFRLSGALWRFWWARGHLREGRQWLERALANPDARANVPVPALVKVLNGAGNLAFAQGDYAAARVFHEEALSLRRILGDELGIAGSLNNLGNVAVELADYPSARSYLEEALALTRKLGNKLWASVVIMNLAMVIREQSEYERAWALFEESLAIQRELGNDSAVSNALNGLGLVANEKGDYSAARSYLEEALEADQRLGDRLGVAMGLHNLATVAQEEGDYQTATALFEQSLGMKRELGDKRGIGSGLFSLGVIAYEQGDLRKARTLLEESLAARKEMNGKRGIESCLLYLGNLARDEGDYQEAHRLYRESLYLGIETGDKRGVAHAVLELGYMACKLGEPQRAARLVSAVDAWFESMGTPLSPAQRPRYERALSAIHAELGEEGWQKAREEGSVMTMEQAVRYALEE